MPRLKNTLLFVAFAVLPALALEDFASDLAPFRRESAGMAVPSVEIRPSVQAPAAEPGFSSAVSPEQAGLLRVKFGENAGKRIAYWQSFIVSLRRETAGRAGEDGELLSRVNDFFNSLGFFNDRDHWGVEDYWAVPAETVAGGGGDCEDLAIAKYFALKELGAPGRSLRLTHVRARGVAQVHMVLAYYPPYGSSPLLLDNLSEKVLPAEARPDLLPVFSFNEEGLFLVKPDFSASPAGPAQRVGLWRDFLKRLRNDAAR